MKELINLSKEKGFESDLDRLLSMISYMDSESERIDRDLVPYLWMYELQRWLRENHNIHVDVETYEAIDPEIKVWYDYIVQDFEGTYIKTNDMSSLYQERLEKGLNKALNLIK